MAKIPLFTLLTIVFSSLSVPTLTAFDSATANQPKPLEIQRITPEGADVPSGRQIVFQFNQPVVPVGKMERQAAEIPITITPSVQCQWRWLNTSALACELGDKTALQKATQYHIQVQPGIMTEAKQTLAKSVEHAFITERPSVDYSSFETWRAPGMPDIRVSFNQPVTRISVETHLYMQEANGERIPVVAKLPSSDSEEATEESETPPAPVVSEPVVDATESNRWIVSPKKLLPLDAKLQLKVEPGIISILGTEAGVENEVVVEFHTFPEFKFLGIRCTDLADQSIDFLPGEKFTTNQRCDPLRQVGLLFSSPVISEVAKENLVVIPDLAGGRKDYNPWENASSGYSRLSNLHNKGDVYELWLPELLQAYQNYQIKIFNPSLFQDEFGRPLPNPVEMQFATDHRAPDYTFEHNISVLEKDVDSELPLYVTNLQKVDVEYSVLTAEGWTSTKKSAVTNIPRLQDVSVKIPFGIRQLLAETSGVVKGCFHTLPTVNDDSCESDENWQTWFFSQVTPYHVQTKIGYHNTLIWITDFATGQPVSDMNVSIYRDTYLADDESALPEILAKANTNVEGIAWLPGTETLDPELLLSNVYDRKVPRFFIRCEKEGEIALLPLDYDFRVEIYDLLGEEANWYPEMQPKYGHIHTWGTTAQGIYKVGDMIQYKFLVRDQSNKQFVPAPKDGYTLKIIDPKDKIVQEIKELSLNDFGSYAGEFAVPKTAAVGWYQFELSANFSKKIWQPMRVLVSDFTPSPFHVQTVINGDLFHLGDTVPVDTTATLHAGGPYAKAPLRLTAVLSQQDFAPTHPQAQGFQFDVYVENVNDDTVYQTEAEIDEKGQLHSSFVLPQSSPVLYGNLLVESAVQDDRGKDVAQSATAKYVGRDRFVGLKQTSWVLNALDPAEVKLIVVDAQGNPTTGTAIKVTIEHQETKASRVKGAGNAYLTQYEHEWIATGQCETISDTTPVTCTFTPPKAGAYQITAQISDTQGLPHSSRLQQWSMGKDWVVWETAPTNMLEMTAEKASYQVGETARYLVKNPYPGSMGLITIERFGTLKTWVHALPTSTEIIEVPVEADYVPGFFVSVTVMSPRVDKPINEEQVDLGKPAFRMGYAKTEVEDPYKEILVDIQTDKPVYKPHETVTVNLQAKFRHPLSSIAQEGNADAQNNEKMELAVTVLDESVYDLLAQGRDYFDPYRGFYTLDGLDMVNYSLLTRLIGRQKFEKKGATSGGDGGMGPGMRLVFKFVSYWNPSIVADADGKAQFQFTVPDNLTGWRILAMAVTPNDRMGLSDANFKVNQPIEIRPALPNQVLTGDSFYAGFTIMNRTDKAREVQVTLNVKGPAEATECALITVNCGTTHTLQTEPFKRYTVWLPLRTTQDGTLQFNVVAEDTSDKERDGLNVSLPVQKRRSMDVAATYGTTIANELRESVKFPADIYPDTGGLEVIFTPTVIGGVEGAFTYMRDYPYICWEQKLSKGVMAAHFKNLHTYLPESVTWEGSEKLPEKTLELAIDYQAPNGGMAFLVAQDDRVSPYLSAYTALAFNWLRDSGYKIPDSVENKLHEYLLTMLRKEVLPTFYSEGMTSSVRAVALAALARHSKITRDDLERYLSHLKKMDLFGKAQFLYAALRVPKTDKLRTEAANAILAVANQTAGKVSFTESLDDGYKRILTSSLRTQCAILTSLVEYDEAMGKKSTVGDIPFRLVNEITQTRKNRDHWENTQENMFCMNALTVYARVYETETPNMTVRSWLDAEKLGETHFDDVKNPPVTVTHAMSAQDPGREAEVKIQRDGQGRVYYGVRMTYASKEERATAVNAGIEVTREYHVERDGQWVLLTDCKALPCKPMEIHRGELVRVDLYVSLPAPRHFVVVDDPVPGGLEPVNRDLATSSKIDADKAEGQYAGGAYWFRFQDWHEFGVSLWNFYHQELRHQAALFYADYLPAGNYHLSYVAQAVAPGEFGVLPTHSEEMYSPEVYGKGLPAILKVDSQH